MIEVCITERKLEKFARLLVHKPLCDLGFYEVLRLLTLFFQEAGVRVLYNVKEENSK